VFSTKPSSFTNNNLIRYNKHFTFKEESSSLVAASNPNSPQHYMTSNNDDVISVAMVTSDALLG